MEKSNQTQKKLNEAIKYVKRIFQKNIYSEAAIRRKLSEKGFDEVSDEILDTLRDIGLVNDEKFVKYIAVNIAEFKKYGPNRIRRILVSKGYEEYLVDNAISEMDVDFYKIAYEDAKKFLKKKNFKNNFDAKQKLYSHLIYKGFDTEIIEETLKEVKEENE
jgi:regulatory protein